FKGIICADVSEFESHMPSHAVRSPPAQKWHCTARSPRSGPPSAASSICRETTTLLRSTLILAAMLVASLTSASIAACACNAQPPLEMTLSVHVVGRCLRASYYHGRARREAPCVGKAVRRRSPEGAPKVRLRQGSRGTVWRTF